MHSKLLHTYSCSHVVKSLFCLIEAVGQSPETLFGRVEEKLLDVAQSFWKNREENMQNSWKKDKQMLLEKMVLFLCQQISTGAAKKPTQR